MRFSYFSCSFSSSGQAEAKAIQEPEWKFEDNQIGKLVKEDIDQQFEATYGIKISELEKLKESKDKPASKAEDKFKAAPKVEQKNAAPKTSKKKRNQMNWEEAEAYLDKLELEV